MEDIAREFPSLTVVGLADDYRFVGPAIDAMDATAQYRRRVEAVGHVFQVSKSWYFSHSPETMELAAGHPLGMEWLVGAEVHKRFEEWDGVARGTITAYDTDYPKAWTVTYEADGVSEEFNAQDVQNYVIKRIDGESPPDGGQSLMEKYRSKQVDPPEWGDGTQDVIPSDRHPQDIHIPASLKCYSTQSERIRQVRPHSILYTACCSVGSAAYPRRASRSA